jgi:hypothetical protein
LKKCKAAKSRFLVASKLREAMERCRSGGTIGLLVSFCRSLLDEPHGLGAQPINGTDGVAIPAGTLIQATSIPSPHGDSAE